MNKGFNEKIYEKLKLVPKGRVTTYKELAKAVGSRAYRAVGQAMRNNPYAPEVACHRVVSSDGRLYGFKGSQEDKELLEKEKMLNEEGVKTDRGKVLEFERVIFQFK